LPTSKFFHPNPKREKPKMEEPVEIQPLGKELLTPVVLKHQPLTENKKRKNGVLLEEKIKACKDFGIIVMQNLILT